MKESAKYRETFGARLCADIRAKPMKPARMSTLSIEEERTRVEGTWRDGCSSAFSSIL